MEHMQDIATQNPDKQKEWFKKLEEGKLSIRDWRETNTKCHEHVRTIYLFNPSF